MTDYDDRGAYTPPGDRLAFDPRQPVRGGGPAPVTLILSGLVLVAVAGGVFYLYRDGFRHRDSGPSLVGAPVAEVKTPAAAPAADAAPSGLVIEKTAPANTTPAFAPPPEEPLPRPAPLAAAPAPAPRVVTPRVVTLAPAPPATATPAAAKSTAATAPKPTAATAPAAASAHPRVVTIASLTDEALGHRLPATAASATTPPASLAPKTPAAASPAPAAVHASAAGWVQIGAYSSSALAEQGWRDIARLEAGPMAGKGKAVQPLQKDGKTLYRAYVTGFPSVAAAEAFCGELKAAGKACMVK